MWGFPIVAAGILFDVGRLVNAPKNQLRGDADDRQHLAQQAEAVFAATDRQYLCLQRPEAITAGSTVCTFFRFHKDRDRYGGSCHVVGRPEDVEHAIRWLFLECVRLRYLRGLTDLGNANERLRLYLESCIPIPATGDSSRQLLLTQPLCARVRILRRAAPGETT